MYGSSLSTTSPWYLAQIWWALLDKSWPGNFPKFSVIDRLEDVVPSVTKHCSGVLLETFLGGIVEIVLFMVLLKKNNSENNDLIPVIQAAILGSILANLLLCLGFCFFVGGMNRDEQDFDEAISEVGSGLMLVAGFGLLIPSAFYNSLANISPEVTATLPQRVLKISRSTAVILLAAYLMYDHMFTPINTLDRSDLSL